MFYAQNPVEVDKALVKNMVQSSGDATTVHGKSTPQYKQVSVVANKIVLSAQSLCKRKLKEATDQRAANIAAAKETGSIDLEIERWSNAVFRMKVANACCAISFSSNFRSCDMMLSDVLTSLV
jgi:hypothetical protein